MPNKKIRDLTPIPALVGAELLEIDNLTLSDLNVTPNLLSTFAVITKTYAALTTTDKTVQGAINELYGMISDENLWDRALYSGSVYYVTPHTAGDVLKLKNNIYLGTVDPFSRTQFWNYEANSVIRLGALQGDGDPVNVTSEGSVFYGANAQGDVMASADFSYSRIKPHRIGLYNAKSSGYTGYLFRADTATDEFYLRKNDGTKVLDFVRATGVLTLSALSLAGGIVQTSSAGVLSTSVTLPNGTLATTQDPGDNSTKLATTAFVNSHPGTKLPKKDTLVVTGGNTVTLSETPPSEDALLIARNGLIQEVGAGKDYTRSGKTVTFEYDVTGQKIIAYYSY